MPLWLRLFRLFFTALGGLAVAEQGWHSVIGQGLPAGNYFSFFTIQSNLLALVVLSLESYRPAWLPPLKRDLLRGAVVLYLMITGVVYALLLSHLPEVRAMMVPWADVVLHRLMPLWMLADWLVAPPTTPVTFRRALVWMAFPFAYIVYSLVRGSVVQWYPYPFLNPEQPGSYTALAAYCTGISLLGLLGAWLVVKVGQWRR